MEITEVRIKLTHDSDDRLQAFCSITFDDCFVVRDLKVIEGTNGPFVAMPSRKLTSHCSRCGGKNHLRANYCNQCGSKLNPDRAPRDSEGRAKLYADIAHPINSRSREAIQDRVIAAYREELELAKSPDYVSRYDEEYDDDFTASDLKDESPRTGGTSSPSAQPQRTYERTDEPTADSSTGVVPDPHTSTLPQSSEGRHESKPHPTEPSQQINPPHDPPKRKPGFGAGILDE